ncbi:MAG: hypothetical protein KBG80_03405 [Breznakibacter sp.]|nr:hypothetical protein [Breznakibacter sp.]
MQSLEGQKLIYKLQNELQDKGLVVESTISDLKALRALMLEEKDPFLTKMLRLMYQHLEAHNGFFVPIPSDDVDSEEEGGEEKEEPTIGVESLLFLLELITDSKNRHNRADLQAYMDSLQEYNG